MHARRLFTQGRYTWRHDSVLRIMKRHFLSFWQSTSTQNAITQRANLSSQPYIRFVPAGSVPRRPDRYQAHSSNLHNRHPMSSSKALLLNANDWEFLFDLGDSQLVFPQRLRSPPNGLILSFSLGQKRQSF